MESQYPDEPSRRPDVLGAATWQGALARKRVTHRQPGCCRVPPASRTAASPAPTISVCPQGQPIIPVAGFADALPLVPGPVGRAATRASPRRCLQA